MKIIRIKKTTSTSDYVKKFIKKRRSVTVIADFQTNGKGTKGRSFSSKTGGIYESTLTFYNDLAAADAFSIVVNSSMAVVKTLIAFGLNPLIKWPNDVYVGGKKICGILTENHITTEGKIDYSVVGIGINVNNEIGDDLKDIAVSMKEILGRSVDKESVLMTLLFNLSGKSNFSDYKKYSLVLGKTLTISEKDELYQAVAKDISPDGALLLESGKKLLSAEVKIKKISQ